MAVSDDSLCHKCVFEPLFLAGNRTTSRPTDAWQYRTLVMRSEEDIFLALRQSQILERKELVQGFLDLSLYKWGPELPLFPVTMSHIVSIIVIVTVIVSTTVIVAKMVHFGIIISAASITTSCAAIIFIFSLVTAVIILHCSSYMNANGHICSFET